MDKNSITPLFTTDYSFRSILNIEKVAKIKDNAPVSIIDIAQEYNLDPFFVIEKNFTGYLKLYKYAKEINKQFVFGLKLVVVPDLNEKTQDSLKNESKVVILLNNSQGYYDAIKIYSLAATTGKYYVPRIDWKSLCKMWTTNLTLAIPFYDSFLHVNLLTTGNVVPEFPMEPVFCLEDHALPFDFLIQDAVNNYCKINKNEIINTHTCYCYKNSDTQSLQVYRTILERSTLSMPNLNHFSSDRFSFESYLNLRGKEIKC